MASCDRKGTESYKKAWYYGINEKGGNNMKKVFNLIFILIMLAIFIMSLAMISTAEGKTISYKSTIAKNTKYPTLSECIENKYQGKEFYFYKNFYLILDNYDIYKYLGFNDKSKSFFKDNLLIVNYIRGGSVRGYIGIKYKNTGVTIKNGVINVSYTYTREPVNPAVVEYGVDVIELKKSGVKGVDLTKQKVTIRTVQLTSRPEDEQIPDSYYTNGLTYVDAEKLIEKPSKVEKVKVKQTKKKQLKVTWKNIKGVKYEVKYSLKKSMKKAKTKKNIKNNKVTLKKLGSGKKYYIKVRAYLKIRDKTYVGKWSKKAVKKVG